MTLLFLGLGLWVLAHWAKRLAPGLRGAMQDKMGEASKGVMALLLVVSIVLMVLGYRAAEVTPLWQPPSFLTHLNNLLMLLAFYTFGASAAKTGKVKLAQRIRHPQLAGFSIWAVAHLLVNGDLASVVLFGGLLLWAQVSIVIINAQEGPWVAPAWAGKPAEIRLAIITLVLFTVVALTHSWLGVWPFGG